MENLLFKNVQCKGYLEKAETKYVYVSNEEDEYIEDDSSITLNAGSSCEQQTWKFKEKDFEGICVGIYLKYTKREYVDCVNDCCYGKEEKFILTNNKEPIRVAKVFYGNNKSHLVPISAIKLWEAPF